MVVPNFSTPVMLGWNEGDGVSLYNILDRTRKPILMGLRPIDLEANRTWLSGDTLYVAPTLYQGQLRQLLEVSLSK